mmetsp:Transcript_76652/g.124009  ORF Transcript_76652/g.124009 Transcript_76652/m.124009 type:complete len:82 (+) Transcript_76652:181-426(+)
MVLRATCTGERVVGRGDRGLLPDAVAVGDNGGEVGGIMGPAVFAGMDDAALTALAAGSVERTTQATGPEVGDGTGMLLSGP